MRKVDFKRWIRPVYENSKPKEGTGCFQSEYENEGFFHQFANAYEESSAGFGNYTVALVELPDGTIEEVPTTMIKFLTPQNAPVAGKEINMDKYIKITVTETESGDGRNVTYSTNGLTNMEEVGLLRSYETLILAKILNNLSNPPSGDEGKEL